MKFSKLDDMLANFRKNTRESRGFNNEENVSEIKAE